MVDLAWPLSPDMHQTNPLLAHYTKAAWSWAQVFQLIRYITSQIAEQDIGGKLCPATYYLPYISDRLPLGFENGLTLNFFLLS